MYWFWWFDTYFTVCDFLLYLGRIKDVERISILNKYKKKYKWIVYFCKLLDDNNIKSEDLILDLDKINYRYFLEVAFPAKNIEKVLGSIKMNFIEFIQYCEKKIKGKEKAPKQTGQIKKETKFKVKHWSKIDLNVIFGKTDSWYKRAYRYVKINTPQFIWIDINSPRFRRKLKQSIENMRYRRRMLEQDFKRNFPTVWFYLVKLYNFLSGKSGGFFF